MLINVTEKHIAKAFKGSELCPIAWAIRDVVEEYADVRVGLHLAHVENKIYQLPPEAQDFIENFDIHGKNAVNPFEFELKEYEIISK